MIPNLPLRLTVLMPLRDDWTSAAELVRRLDKAISRDLCTMDIVLIDDNSVQRCNVAAFQASFSVVRTIQTLRLRRNLGHQRAIAIGLAYLYNIVFTGEVLPDGPAKGDAVAVMDADGEDTPEGLAQLLQAYIADNGSRAIFAERSRRSESLIFRGFYYLYKVLHRSLTGISVRVGNFSILPAHYLSTLVVLSELWNHYAAAVFRSKLPFTMTPIPRGTRIAGSSTMNFVTLVSHGLSAISVFGDVVGVRLLIGSLAVAVLAGLGMPIIAAGLVFTDWRLPWWATYAIGIVAIILIQLITIAASFTFSMLFNRTNLGFVPIRDYSLFVEDAVYIYKT